MSVQQFCLRWNNHQPNFISVCSSLLHNGTLVDVTLAAEGRQLQAHKIVLSACSSYFQTLFTSNPCQHPIVILKDVQYNDLKTMVDFMYYGEVNVSQEQLPHILKTAEMLKIKGLAEMPDAAASLTKSDSKTSSDQTEQHQGTIGSAGSESIWGSTESQFQHHQQQQQQQNQSQQQQRRTPSPAITGASPAARRKRLRKSSNSGSGERTSEEQGNIEGSSNINISHVGQMSFTGSNTNLTTIHPKIIKESSSIDTENHPHDSSQESIEDNQHHVQQIKPETDISGVSQSIPLDISGPTTPSEHEAPNVSQSQSSHSGVQWTVVDSSYPRFSLSSCQGNISIGGESSQANDDGNSATNSQHAQQTVNTSIDNNTVVTTNQQQQQGHIQMHYQGSSYTPQIISVNNLVSSYSQNLSTPTSPSDSGMVQSVYSQGPTPTQSPVHQMTTSSSGGSNPPSANSNSGQNQSSSSSSAPAKRKRSINPQGDENFKMALEAVRTGGIGFCKAARLYGVNNRTLWLEYKKRGYPISRPSIKSRIKLEPNMSPPPQKKDDNISIENYDGINQQAINMQVPPTSETPTPIMCTPHTHPMGVMSFLDTRHMEFSTGIHPTMSRQRYTDSATVNVNTSAINLQGLNFNSM